MDTASRVLRCRSLMVYLVAVLLLLQGCSMEARWADLDKRATQLYEDARLSEAENVAKKALELAETTEPNELNVATSLNRLGDIYLWQARYGDAEPLYNRALAIRERLLGPEDPAVAETLNGLGELRTYEGRYSDALTFFEQALSIRQKVLGVDNRYVTETVNDLGVFFEKGGKYETAEMLHERALAVREKLLGPSDPCVAQSLNNLAVVRKQQDN